MEHGIVPRPRFSNYRYQLRLPMALKCCNPTCHNDTYQGQPFCGDSCYWDVERLNRLGERLGRRLTVERRETSV